MPGCCCRRHTAATPNSSILFQIEGRDVLFDWLEHETDVAKKDVMLAFLADLAEDPLKNAYRVPGISAPVFLVVTPVNNLTLKFLYAQQFKVLKLIEFEPLP